MKSEHVDMRMNKPVMVRLFPDVEQEIDEIMNHPDNRGKWQNKPHFLRCAAINYIKIIRKEINDDGNQQSTAKND